MCVVSMITDYPNRLPNDSPHSSPWSGWDLQQYKQWKKLIEEAQKFDKMTGQPDCPSEEKRKLLQEMQEYFDKKFAELKKELQETKHD